jgi:predicted alpha/beta hydrolase family esterase
MKKQVIVIHGGEAYKSKEEFLSVLENRSVTKESFFPKQSWKNFLQRELGDEFEVLAPRMPNKQNAKYVEWKTWFERMHPFVERGVVLIGHSMGGIFLTKYLLENIFPKKIGALFLVAAPFDLKGSVCEFRLSGDLQKVWNQCQNIHIFQSLDDPVVPATEADMYKQNWPKAHFHIFRDRGHFNQEDFPELVGEVGRL